MSAYYFRLNIVVNKVIMTKRKQTDLDKIPETLQKIVALIDKEINTMSDKDELSAEDSRNLISFTGLLTSIYKDYRAECLAIEKELRGKTKEDIMNIIKADVVKHEE